MGLKSLQNQSLDLKTFRDRFVSVFELFWSPLWLLKSIKTKQQINQIFETVSDAIWSDGWDPERLESGRPGGRGGAAGGLNSLTESDKS